MIFEHVGIYADWLEDHGADCSLLRLLLLKQTDVFRESDAFEMSRKNGNGAGYSNYCRGEGNGSGEGEYGSYLGGGALNYVTCTFGDGEYGSGDGNGCGGPTES